MISVIEINDIKVKSIFLKCFEILHLLGKNDMNNVLVDLAMAHGNAATFVTLYVVE